MPRHVSAARFDYRTRRVPCTEDTRTEVLATIYDSFKGGNLNTDEVLPTKGNVQGRIFWLDGVAGTGKSTIAQTVANHFEETKMLGGSFFCSRDNADGSNVNLIFLTIAYQLSSFNPMFKKHLSEAMGRDADVQYALPSRQLKKLIVEPLGAVMLNQGFPQCIIVIDALDECKDENSISTILSALADSASDLLQLKFFITSRPVMNIVDGFRETGLMKDTSALVLHSIPSDISDKDIHIYLDKQLSRIRRSFGLGSSWPSMEDLNSLVKQSCGLFIFAATAVKFIEDPNITNPEGQLVRLMSTAYIVSGKNLPSPHSHLDTLYLQVLHEAFPNISGEQRVRLKTVLGTVVLLFDPLDPESLEALLGLNEHTVRATLCRLHSIIIVPDAGAGSVRLIHPSSHDFLIDGDRCNDINFVVNPQLQNTFLAECCLRALQTLSPDMCKIGNPSLYNQEVSDLQDKIATHIPLHIQYACQHWASHLSSNNIHDTILELLDRFCSNQLLNWLEVMSLLGTLDGAISALQSAHQIVRVSALSSLADQSANNDHFK